MKAFIGQYTVDSDKLYIQYKVGNHYRTTSLDMPPEGAITSEQIIAQIKASNSKLEKLTAQAAVIEEMAGTWVEIGEEEVKGE